MSSRLMPPSVGSSAAMMSTSLSGSVSASSMSKTSMPANFLNRHPLPSMTGLAASGPILPRPSTAVPLVITPTRFDREVYMDAACSPSAWMDMQATATPGEYASERSSWLASGFVGMTEILPGDGLAWQSKASLARSALAAMSTAPDENKKTEKLTGLPGWIKKM